MVSKSMLSATNVSSLVCALLFVIMSVPFSAATPVSFEVITESASGPPFPTENIVVNLLEDDGLGALEHTATMQWSTDISSSKATPKLLETVAKGVTAGQQSVRFDLIYDGDGTDLAPDTFFDITHRVAFQGQPGTTPELSVTEFLFDGDIWSASCNMGGHKAGGGGTGVGRVGGKMHLEDVSLGIVSVGLTHNGVDPFFDITYRLHLADPMQILPNQTLTSLTFTAQSVPEPSSMAMSLLALAGIGAYVTSRRGRRESLSPT